MKGLIVLNPVSNSMGFTVRGFRVVPVWGLIFLLVLYGSFNGVWGLVFISVL